MVTMPYLTGLEDRIFYTKQGRGHPSSLLLIHGAGGSHLDWPAEIRRLTHIDVYAIDLPGHGRSPGFGKDSIDGYADDVIHLIKSLGLNQVIVAGYSMGGAIALEIGSRNLPAVTGLVLISTGARLRVAEQVLNLIFNDFAKATDLIAGLSWSPEAPEYLVALAKERMLASDPQVTLTDFSACDSFDLMDDLPAIDLPVLVISGSVDRLTPPKYGKLLSEDLPKARLVEIKGGGHMVFIEKPVLVAKAISSFLEESGLSLPDSSETGS